jgi:hypothetical protein
MEITRGLAYKNTQSIDQTKSIKTDIDNMTFC